MVVLFLQKEHMPISQLSMDITNTVIKKKKVKQKKIQNMLELRILALACCFLVYTVISVCFSSLFLYSLHKPAFFWRVCGGITQISMKAVGKFNFKLLTLTGKDLH